MLSYCVVLLIDGYGRVLRVYKFKLPLPMFSYQLMAIGGNQMSACLSEGASVQVSLFFKIMPALFLIPRNLSFFQLLLQLKQPVTKRPLTGRRQPKLSNCQPKTERKRTEVQMRRQLSGAAGNPLAGNQTD